MVNIHTDATAINIDDEHAQHRFIQNFCLTWVDYESENDYEIAVEQLGAIVNNIYAFNDTDSCINSLPKLNKIMVFVIVSSNLCQQLVPLIHDNSHIEAIYILGNDTTESDRWSKVKGIYSKITSICNQLKEDVKQCNQNNISLSFVPSSDGSRRQDLEQLDPSFMYSQILKEILLSNTYDQKSVADFITFCKELYERNISIPKVIAEFEEKYPEPSPVWWYTRPEFIYEILNKGLRNLEADIVTKMGFFIENLHKQIKNLHAEQNIRTQKDPFIVYRGQGLSESDFQRLLETQGGLISFNNFLSTSIYRDVADMLAESNSYRSNTVGILFKIKVNPGISSSPFARIDEISYFPKEGEILFSMHTIFRIRDIKQTENNPSVWEVEIESTSDADPQLSALTQQITEETSGSTTQERLGKLMCKIGQFEEAEKLYFTLLQETQDLLKQAKFYEQIGEIKKNQKVYDDAIKFHEKSLQLKEQILSAHDPELGMAYIHTGLAYIMVKNFERAHQLNNRGKSILQSNTPSNHSDVINSYIDTGRLHGLTSKHLEELLLQEKVLDNSEQMSPSRPSHLVTSYNNIGIIYHNMGECAKALLYYQKAFEIFKQTLPSNHPSIASSYNNIGSLFKNLGQFSKALENHEKSLEIRQKTLPPNHPDLAISYNNIAMVHQSMGEHSKALEYHGKSLEIRQSILPSNHPDLAISYNNIGMVYQSMAEYSKALEYHGKSLDIRQKTLPSNHLDLALSYNNIGMVYQSMGEHSKALEYHGKSLEIRQSILPSNHPDLAISYNNIGMVYQSMAEYSKALEYHGKSLDIRQKTLPSNHLDLALSYNNIGMVYQSMGEHSKALEYHEKSLKIRQSILPSNHTDLTISYNNIGMVYESMGEHSRALEYLQISLTI